MPQQVVILNNLSDGYFDKGVKESKKVQYKFGMSITEVRNSNLGLPVIFVTYSGLAGNFRLDIADTITPDDGANVLISLNNRRYKRVDGFTARKESFTNLVIGNNSVVLQYKPYNLNELQVYRNGDLTNDYAINNKVITFLVPFAPSVGAIMSEEIDVYFFS